ncbi:MAG: hypothetical protein F6J89_20640 [Symploca sp. SIO1C4]|uniref:Uncharacterized protein n=1 Tax=Symploca sp. SIO1C4 TaxID=2607765 RepID=A0A6B3N8L6_9CYAN|nr:hypothetical protein [Symploca sp. SIO1C4]
MLKKSLFQQPSRNWLKLTETLAPLTVTIALLTSVVMPAQARTVSVRSHSSSSYIESSPTPTTVPINHVSGHPSRFSRSRYNHYDSDYDSDYDHRYHRGRRPARRRSILINPRIRIRNSRRRHSDVIYYSPRYRTNRRRHSDFFYHSPRYRTNRRRHSDFFYYSPRGVIIRIGR